MKDKTLSQLYADYRMIWMGKHKTLKNFPKFEFKMKKIGGK